MECGYGRSRTSPRTGPARPDAVHEKERRERRAPRRRAVFGSHHAPKIAAVAIHYRARACVSAFMLAGPINFRHFITPTCAPIYDYRDYLPGLAPDSSPVGKNRGSNCPRKLIRTWLIRLDGISVESNPLRLIRRCLLKIHFYHAARFVSITVCI